MRTYCLRIAIGCCGYWVGVVAGLLKLGFVVYRFVIATRLAYVVTASVCV
ncbi:hypothetical protein [Odoribacter laneus]|nr:hypothetical protein [Odoribacter laneus]